MNNDANQERNNSPELSQPKSHQDKVFKKQTTINEVNNLLFLQNKVSCPKYIRHYIENDKLFLEMEKIDGKDLFKIIGDLNEKDSYAIAKNIVNEIKKLRKLEIDINYTVNDAILGKLEFNNEEDLNEIIVSNLKDVNMRNLCRKILPIDSKFVLSHGDLHLYNILVKDDLSVVFIDRETLSYLPDYWDPMKIFALFHSDSELPSHIIDELKPNLVALICHHEIVRAMF